MTAVIDVRGLTKRYGDVAAVTDLTFSVPRGSVTGFLGPNGAGKTTTLRMLLGLVTPTGGVALIGGRPYGQLPHPTRHVGAVLESSGFHPGRRARDHLRVLATAAGIPASRVDEVLAEVLLTDAAQRRVGGFSLGMRQRLGLASALLGHPEVLILDEPANGLDPGGVHWLRTFVRSFADQGGTVLVSSHLLAEISLLVDDIVIIARGSLITHASLEELSRTATAGTRVKTPHAAQLRGALAAKGITVEQRDRETLVAFDVSPDAVGLAAAGAGAVIYEMTSERFDLEALFLDLTSAHGDPR